MCSPVGSDGEIVPAGNPGEVVIEGSVSPLEPVAQASKPDRIGGPVTDQQRKFIFELLQNGGKVSQAAIAAGYAHESYGARLLSKVHISRELERRVKLSAGSALAIALGNLLEIIETSTDHRARVQAALGIMDRMGMAPPRGPAVAVQINNGMTGGQANSLIEEALRRRDARLTQQEAA